MNKHPTQQGEAADDGYLVFEYHRFCEANALPCEFVKHFKRRSIVMRDIPTQADKEDIVLRAASVAPDIIIFYAHFL